MREADLASISSISLMAPLVSRVLSMLEVCHALVTAEQTRARAQGEGPSGIAANGNSTDLTLV